MVYENSNQRREIYSALDLSRGYADKWDSCIEEVFDLRNATSYERKGCSYPPSCFNNVEDYLKQFPKGEVPETLCTYQIYCGESNWGLGK